MKIVLVEERNGKLLSEKPFDLELIRIGRNAAECQIVYENEAFPMVSRIHAELRWQGNSWFVFDANSSFGTFVNGTKVVQPRSVAKGNQIQFGTNGPVLHVVSVGEAVPAQQTPVVSQVNLRNPIVRRKTNRIFLQKMIREADLRKFLLWNSLIPVVPLHQFYFQNPVSG
jgi:pSer/pThr/pTyr-binding forkhead associated (FHA) protein